MNGKLLAIDTASEGCSAALYIDGEVYSEYSDKPQAHSELILGMCDQLLSSAGLKPAELDAMAFSRGPGSFTGVRIGAGVVQGIAYAADIPVVPVSTLASLAYQAFRLHGHEHVIAAMDARMNEVYYACYRLEDFKAELIDEELVRPASKLPPPTSTQAWAASGKAWQVYSEDMRAQFKSVDISNFYEDATPHAQDVAVLAAGLYQQGQHCTPEQAIPVYLRDKVAEKSKKAG